MRAHASTCVLAAFVAAVSTAFAQGPNDSRRVGVVVGRSFAAGESGPALSLQGSFRVHPRVSIQADLSQTGLDYGEYPACPPNLFCVAIIGGTLSLTADVISVQGHLVADLSTPASRFRPYVFAGGGIANVRRELRTR